MRDFTEYRYKSTLERELGLAVCRLWSLAAQEGASPLLDRALDGLEAAQLESLRQALRLVRREQVMDTPLVDGGETGTAAKSGGGDDEKAGGGSGGGLVGEGEAEAEAETALATLPWDEGPSRWQLDDLEAQLARRGYGMIRREPMA